MYRILHIISSFFVVCPKEAGISLYFKNFRGGMHDEKENVNRKDINGVRINFIFLGTCYAKFHSSYWCV